ncbi:hypothetical protein, partial [Enterobacter sp.]|uniref:hypothetical protein n=1 Tax=Enterobacter sp. TaxID=42895 RepID=UPI00296EEE75
SVALPTELSRHQVARILGRPAPACNKKIAENVLSLTFCAPAWKNAVISCRAEQLFSKLGAGEVKKPRINRSSSPALRRLCTPRAIFLPVRRLYFSFIARSHLILAFVMLAFESARRGDFFLLFLFIWCYPPAYCPNLTYMQRAIVAV